MPDDVVAAPEAAKAAKTAEPGMAQKWKAASGRWAKEAKLAYLSNPTARRDFRVQFRGNRSAPLFALLLVVLTVITLFVYWQATKGGLTPEGIQGSLLIFCAIIFMILGSSIILITPALAAASILSEKQRRSLDLVFSSPIKPSTYLLGKLMASYRYVWVFMALSLPFTAISVIMGGGTWWNVVECYFLLSLHGLLFTSIGLYFASVLQKTLTALFYTYLTVIGYITLLAVVGKPVASNGAFAPFSGGEQNPLGSLVPLYVQFASGTYTNILGVAVPNFLIAAGLTFGAVRFIIRAAGGFLSPLSDKARRGLRIESGLILAGISAAAGASASAQTLQGVPATMAALLPVAPLFIFMPFLACYGSDGERRQVHARLFAIRDIFGNSVAGALPYVYSLLAISGGAFFAGEAAVSHAVTPETLLSILYGFGLWTFGWATARFASSFNLGMSASRTLQFLTIAGVVGLPLPLFLLAGRDIGNPEVIHSTWKWFLLSPLVGQFDSVTALVLAAGLFVSGLGLAFWSEGNYRRRVEAKKLAKMAGESVSVPTVEYPVLLADKRSVEVQHLTQGV